MCRVLTAVVVLGMWLGGALAQPPGKDEARSRPDAKTPDRAAPAAAARPDMRTALIKMAQERPEPAANARMVLVRFVIAQVTLRGVEKTADKPVAATPDAAGGTVPAKSPIVAMPEQSLFDAERLNKQLQAAPLDLRAGGGQLGERLTGLLPDRAVEIVTRGQLVTLDGQHAFIQIGQREPRVTSAQMMHSGRVNTLTLDALGMIAAFKPLVREPGCICLQVNIEKSQHGPVEEGAVIAELPNGEKVRTPDVQTMVVQSTVNAAPGQAVALAGVSTRHDARRMECLILVAAELLERN